MTARPTVDVIVPTVGRESLRPLMSTIASQRSTDDAPIGRVIVVDDRAQRHPPILAPAGGDVLTSGGRGPAAARNVGWRASRAEWICFLDDDVLPQPGWLAALARDVATAPPEVAAVQGHVHVPLPARRRPTDGERNVAGLDGATWITADMAVRRAALETIGGFDERFPRAYREDSDLALRLADAGWQLRLGSRHTDHPPSPATWRDSVRSQRGNADDALVARLHGADWRRRVGASRGLLRQHVITTVSAISAAAAAASGHRRIAAVPLAAWLALSSRFWWRRVAPGPRTRGEVASLATSSLLIPPAATAWAIIGRWRTRGVEPSIRPARRPRLVLFDRDGTLIEDVPYNGNADLVVARPGAREALDRLRAAGIPIGIVTNQSGVAKGLVDAADVERVNRRVAELLGTFDVVLVCAHGPEDGCDCRKPAPGMIIEAAARLGIEPAECVVVGDIGADIEAAAAAGARGILVPNAQTRRAERLAANEVAADLHRAVDRLLGPDG
jgi:histidinol-phosphate phosphatase family protein